ncbi:MAG: hypothetical protein FWF33_04610 [Clostridiales bacterium]|nr:hypothetical protein [Clostridiales bacterium]
MHPVVYVIIVVVVVYAIIMIARAVNRGANSHFICPKCGNDFQVTGAKYAFSPKTFTSHDVTCPKCGYHGFMEVQPGKK